MNTALRRTARAAAGNGLGAKIKHLQRTTSGAWATAGRNDHIPAMYNERRRRHRSWHHDQVPAMLNERRRGQRPVHHSQVPARRRGHRLWHHDQVPATHKERRRGKRPWHHDQVPCEQKRGRGQRMGQGLLHKGVYEFF
jgi:hypothetical protein